MGLLILLAIGIPWTGALVVWLAGEERRATQHRLAVGFAAAAGVAALLLLPGAASEPALSIETGDIFGTFTFIADGLGTLLAVIATVVGSLAVVFSVDYMAEDDPLGRYYGLVLFFIGAMVGLVLSGSLLLVFFFWEITALCSYALIAYYNDDPKAVAGGLKALVITSLGGVGLFTGALAIYAYQGSYQINAFLDGAASFPPEVLSFVGFGFLIAAAAKSAQFPFQTWLPGAMEAPTPISALIHAATMVNAGVYLLARFYPAFEQIPGWTAAVVLTGLLSAGLAAIMALVAHDLKRALAFSTISQLGYMVYAVGAGAVAEAQFHLLSHAVFKALLFLGAGAVIHAAGTRDMRKMGDLGRHMPFTRNAFIVGALALAGLPILNGFWSKEAILEAGLAGGPLWAYIGMLVVAGLTACYTFRMVWLVFFRERHQDHRHLHDAGPMMQIALGVLAFGTLTTWLLIEPFGKLLQNTLPYHHPHAPTFGEFVAHITGAPATWLALAVVAAGLAAWWWRDMLALVLAVLEPVRSAAERDFGFEWVNARAVRLVQNLAENLRQTQTGYLSWNVAGIVAGLVIVLLILLLAPGS